MPWTATLVRRANDVVGIRTNNSRSVDNGMRSILFVHDCGYKIRRSYTDASKSGMLKCPKCDLRESFVLPSYEDLGPVASGTELKRIWQRVEAFNDRYFPEWRHEDLRLMSNALAGEVGELCDASKHFYGGGTNPELVGKEDPEHMAEEVFDAFVYEILFLGAMGYGYSRFCRVADRKLAVLEARMNRGTIDYKREAKIR